jgi:hypothetical protein
VCSLSVVRLRQEEGVVVDLGLGVWPGSLGLAGPRPFRILLAGVLRSRSLLTNQCLETPRDYNPDTHILKFKLCYL